MPLTIWSLNGGRFLGKTRKEEGQPLIWLKYLADPNVPIPDVLFIQDFRIELAPYLVRLPHLAFAAMTDHRVWGERQLVGIAIASRYPLSDVIKEFTWGDGNIRPLQGVDDKNHRLNQPDVDDLVNASEARRYISATIEKDGEHYRVGTTHGFWTRGGVPTTEQAESTERLVKYLTADAVRCGGAVLIADLNLDKDGKTLQCLLAAGARDCLPVTIQTTVAAHHPAARFGAKPDRVMVFPRSDGVYPYKVHGVHMDPAPGSDHDMLCAIVVRG